MARLPIKDELREMRNEMNRMLNEVFNTNRERSDSSDVRQTRSDYRRPVTELNEKEKEYQVTAELPGVQKEDIDLSVNDNVLTIQVDAETTEEEENVTRRRHQSFYRRFTVPRDAETENATASYSNGVLEVRLPKRDSDSNTIEIR